MRCLSCKYDLRNLTLGNGGVYRCPDCGQEFDPVASNTNASPSILNTIVGAALLGFLCLLCIGMLWIGIAMAAGGHGWGTAFLASLAACILIPASVVAWHAPRSLLGLVLLVLVVLLDVRVIGDAVGGDESERLAGVVAHGRPWVVAWFIMWFGWQLLLLRPMFALAYSILMALRR